MAALRTSKSIAERIDINYFKRPHPWRRARTISVCAALALAVAWVAWSVARGDRRIYQAGPVAPAHALFGHDCARCHTNRWQPLRRLATLNSRYRSVPDSACTRCHDGPIHHDNQIADATPGCAGCHREHRGAAELARVSDQHCVSCHQALRTTTGPAGVDPEVMGFERSHPEFAVLRNDRMDLSVISFNHAVHLKPGGVAAPGTPPLRLQCRDCHEPDTERRYMKPIAYEAHCARCHTNSLQFDPERFPYDPVPHREPELVRGVVRERYTRFIQQYPERLSDALPPGPARRVPGRRREPPVTREQWHWVASQIETAQRLLFEGAGGCRYCHRVEPAEDGWRIVKPEIPGRWMSHSIFRHDSHRMLGCTACHPAITSHQTSDLLLPGIDTCRQCHGSEGKARADCVACHQYHDPTRERDFNGSLTIDSISHSIRR